MLYKNAGVDIDVLNLVRKDIGKHVKKTFGRGGRSEFGLFGGIYSMNDEILISSCDSVGTKILIACATDINNTVGADLVNHCVNDILTTGAMPLFFMDYIGFSKVRPKILVDIVSGLAKACTKEKMPLVGGETAQLSRFYPEGVYDLVGFIVGKVRKRDYIDPLKRIKTGHIILGLRSSGLHTNGYSLARRVLLRKYRLSSYVPRLKCTLAQELLKIHRSYRKDLQPRLKYIKGLAHITGGGFYDNIERVLPPGRAAIIRKKAWQPQPVFKLIQELGKVPDDEMYRVFNMGIGMCVVIDKKHLRYFKPLRPRIIGEIVKGNFGTRLE
ncbi:MAG: phosphoribosylformylglycinamidine cyclo-ligase [candidate division WOR-3 bacterium]|nr:MAG: phosphoribosylformylglycinamidine cyclo-ligase [candidate division WOR-3 bacterium]